MARDQRKGLGVLLRRELLWLSLRVISLIIFQLMVETAFKVGWLVFLGPEDVQILVHDVLQKLLLTLYVWFFFAVFKRFFVPTITTAVSPAIEGFVRRPEAKKRTVASLGRYLTYVGYILVIVGLMSIWAYSYIGSWLVGTMGTGLVVSLTFVLGLFTSSVLGNILAYWVLNNTMEFTEGDRVQIGDA